MDGGAWQATVHGVTKSQTQLSDFISLLLLTLGFIPFPQFQLSEVEVNHWKPFFISAEVFGDVFPSKHNFTEFHNFYLFSICIQFTELSNFLVDPSWPHGLLRVCCLVSKYLGRFSRSLSVMCFLFHPIVDRELAPVAVDWTPMSIEAASVAKNKVGTILSACNQSTVSVGSLLQSVGPSDVTTRICGSSVSPLSSTCFCSHVLKLIINRYGQDSL